MYLCPDVSPPRYSNKRSHVDSVLLCVVDLHPSLSEEKQVKGQRTELEHGWSGWTTHQFTCACGRANFEVTFKRLPIFSFTSFSSSFSSCLICLLSCFLVLFVFPVLCVCSLFFHLSRQKNLCLIFMDQQVFVPWRLKSGLFPNKLRGAINE